MDSPAGSIASTAPHAKTWRWWLRPLFVAGLAMSVGLLLIVAMGIAQRLGWIAADKGTAGSADAATIGQTYTCPMHPQIRQPAPGRCPICGMELVVASAMGGTDLDALAIRIEPAQRRLANIETAEVRREPLEATIRTVGAVAIDESRMATIASYIAGRLERLFADYTGVDVAKGDHLAVIYSPDLYAAQLEYVEARKSLGNVTPGTLAIVRETQEKLVASARSRLVELGMNGTQMQDLERSGEAKSRLTIHAPTGGTVVEKPAVEGKYVEAGEPIYRIADLSTVWLRLELYPEDASRIRFGQQVEAELQSLPGGKFAGRVAFIDPTVDVRKRTVGVRVEFLNDHRRLRPGDYARATISLPIGQSGAVYDADLAGRWISPMHPQIIRDAPGPCPICGMDLVPTSRYGYATQPVERPTSLHVPRSAVLMAGSNSVVYVETEPGRFEIRPIALGPILRDKVIVLDGLAVGEHVATAGNFLIDSQMQLAGKPSLIDPAKAIAAKATRNKPLDFPHVHVEAVAGDVGRRLEDLYDAYFGIQRTLAEDRTPTEAQAKTLHQSSSSLATNAELPEASRKQLAEIARRSEHLHHLPIEAGRLDGFRPVSHAIATLATQVRGDAARRPFAHLFCPMVPGGAGDWLQPGGNLRPADLRNPYFGRRMQTCGEIVRELPTGGHGAAAQPTSGPDTPRAEPHGPKK